MLLRTIQCAFFFFNDTATTEIYTLSLHDALPILEITQVDFEGPTIVIYTKNMEVFAESNDLVRQIAQQLRRRIVVRPDDPARSEEHTSELQSLAYLVCRLLLEKKKNKTASVDTTP